MLATASNNSIIKVWNIDSLDCISTLIGHRQAVICVKFCEDDKLLTGSRDGSCKLWSISNSSCIHSFLGHVAAITSIKLWSDFQFFSGSEDGCVKIFNWKLFECKKTLIRPKEEIIKNKCLLYLLNKNY